MKTATAIVNLPIIKKHIYNKKKGKVLKHTASINNTHYNMSVSYYADERTVKEFSIGYTLKELHINDVKPKKNNQLKTSTINKHTSSYSIFYNFVNFSKHDLNTIDNTSINSNKVAMYKSDKVLFYGNEKTDTTKIMIKVSKIAEIYLLLMNIFKQIQENESKIETMKKNKSHPDLLQEEIRVKAKLKSVFIEYVKNILKRYY